ncbi:MAG: DUF4382 domain-containing protein [Candidatus Neomarinimicrobiota bacterium]
MRKYLLLLLALSLMVFIGCETESDETTGIGQIAIQAFDAPFQGDVEHIYLNVIEVSVHKSVSDSTNASDTTAQWIVLSETDTTIDFLELVNGRMATLIQSDLELGHYTQIRLLLGDSSSIVVDGNAYELKVPSGSQSGVKLTHAFEINADEVVEFYLDFDAERSINKHPSQNRYTLQPTFRLFKSVLSGTIAGSVADTAGAGLPDIAVYAVADADTIATLTDEDGGYKFILLDGTYNISAAGYEMTTDTVYQAVSLTAGAELTGYDFILE